MSQLQLLTKFTVMKTQMMIAHHVHSVSQSLTPALAHAAQILKLLTSQRTCFNLKAREIYLHGTFRLLGTANINGLVCAHPLTRYSVIYAVVQISRGCSRQSLLLFMVVFRIGRKQ